VVGCDDREKAVLNAGTSPARVQRLNYPRHFLWLACFSALLAAATRRHMIVLPLPSFLSYGALHASALVLALRVRRSIGRKCLFVALAATLSAVTLGVIMLCRHLVASLPGNGGLFALLGLSSVTGALTYGVLIRTFWIPELRAASLIAMSLGCMLATFLAFLTLSHFAQLGRWWLAVLWWFAFSGGLWGCERWQSPQRWRSSRSPG
jgi:hypothetical protein